MIGKKIKSKDGCQACGVECDGFVLCTDCGVDMVIRYGKGDEETMKKYIARRKSGEPRLMENPDEPFS